MYCFLDFYKVKSYFKKLKKMNINKKKFLTAVVVFLLNLLLSVTKPLADPSGAPTTIIVGDFSKTTIVDGVPSGWEKKEDKGKLNCLIEKDEQGKPVLHIKSNNASGGIHKVIEIDVKQYPYFTWKWKVIKIPPKGDVRKKGTDDQAGNIYVAFPGGFPELVRSKIVSYLWDSNAPKGLMTTSPKRGNTKNIVVENGSEKLGEWITEKRNVYEDYKKLFGEEPPKTAKVSIWIDSDDTESEAEAFYDNLMFMKN